MSPDHIIIVGGGVIGSSIAYHLCNGPYTGSVTVVERDSSYRRASSFLSMGGIRQQFGSTENIRLAQHSIRFYERFDDTLANYKNLPPVRFRQRGYLFLVSEAMSKNFEQRYVTQRKLGADVERLDVETIRKQLPDLVVDDIAFAVFGPKDGYIDPRAVLVGFRNIAETTGATFVESAVTGLMVNGGRINGVTLDNGAILKARAVVCAAGPYAVSLAALADVELPVTPVRQQLFRCELPHYWPYRFPMIVDPSGVHWRHDDPVRNGESDRIVVARTKLDEPAGENFVCDVGRWNTDFRPPLVARLPALAAARLVEGWAGLYEMTPDHNPLIGEHSEIGGFFLANGFSGHGLMMAPAVGAAMSEILTTGSTTLCDISAFDPGRFSSGNYFEDEAMI